MQETIYIFISHSHRDLEKVRKIRNYLESLSSEPILFFLLSLTDKHKITELIKDEIDARLWFIYCKSKNAEASVWVKTEVDYITETDKDTSFTIDLDEAFDENGELLSSQKHRMRSLIKAIKDNKCFYISYAHRDMPIFSNIKEYMNKYGISFVADEDFSVSGLWFDHAKDFIQTSKYFLLLISENSLKSGYVETEMTHAFSLNKTIIPVLIDLNFEQLKTNNEDIYNLISKYECFLFDSKNLEKSCNDLVYQLVRIRKDF